MIRCTRSYEFDAAHRLYHHTGRCGNVHGHRYKVELTVEGWTNPEGMVVDFSSLKATMKEVLDPWDHTLLLNRSDNLGNSISDETERVFRLDFEPTAENMAAYLLDCFRHKLNSRDVRVWRVRVYETPNCWVDAVVED